MAGQPTRHRPPIAANLRRLKAESGLTWEAIAQTVGVTERVVRRWKDDYDSDPSWDFVLRLAELFSVEPHELYAQPNGSDAR